MTRACQKHWNRPERQIAAVLRLVRETPSTSGEVAEELDIPREVAAAVLARLFAYGLVRREEFRREGRRRMWLYTIPSAQRRAA